MYKWLVASCALWAASTASAQQMSSLHYEIVGGSISSAAASGLGPTSVGDSGFTLSESSVGPRMTAPSGITFDSGFRPIVYLPEPELLESVAAAGLLLALLGRRRR